MLPELHRTLKNSLIPLMGLTLASGASLVLGIGAMALVPGRDTKARFFDFCLEASKAGLISSMTYLSVSQLVAWDSRIRVSAWRRGREEIAAGAELHPHQVVAEPSAPVANRVPQPPVSYTDGLRELFRSRYGQPSELDRPDACLGCENWHGWTYTGEKGTNGFVCAMHPFGPIGENCPDHEGYPLEYRLVRIQGSGFQNLYFVWLGAGHNLSDMFLEAIEVPGSDRLRLMKRYHLKSATGLPGCIFKSKSHDIGKAYRELIDSCPD
jgi:hypothetical protein